MLDEIRAWRLPSFVMSLLSFACLMSFALRTVVWLSWRAVKSQIMVVVIVVTMYMI